MGHIKGSKEAEKMVWSTILPHFTAKGLAAFKSYYGEDYLNKLGDPLSAIYDQKQLF